MVSKRYRSKYDLWMVGLLGVGVAVLIWCFIYGFSLVLVVCSIPSLFSLWLVADCLINAYYEVDGNVLRIKFGILLDTRIDIMTIKSILPSRTILSSPAWSMDRLEIKYGKYGSVVVSPADKPGFIDTLLRVNPDIATSRTATSPV